MREEVGYREAKKIVLREPQHSLNTLYHFHIYIYENGADDQRYREYLELIYLRPNTFLLVDKLHDNAVLPKVAKQLLQPGQQERM